jgi:glycolate oxidase FAD binding subunit
VNTSTPTTLRPTDLKAVRDAVLDTPGTIGVSGAGTAAGWAGPLRAVDAVLETTGLTGVIDHNPGDMTVSVRAGTPLRALAEELAPHGQHVAFDAARVAEGATVGGLVATADAGPAALVYGSLRDLVIGTTVVLADGTVARSGGHVIKNVAGYDLAKLLHGSYGTLGVLVEVVLRLHPVPRACSTLGLDCGLADAAGHAATVLQSPYEPVALEWIRGDGGEGDAGRLLVRLEGTPDALPRRVDRLRELLGRERPVRELGVPVRAVRDSGDAAGAGEHDPWARHAELVRGGPDVALLRIGSRPSRLPELLAGLHARSITAGLGTGMATVALPAEDGAVAAAHRAVHAAGGTSVLRARPAGLGAPAWGPPPSALAVLQAVKRSLDPDGRFGPGRFDPWM